MKKLKSNVIFNPPVSTIKLINLSEALTSIRAKIKNQSAFVQAIAQKEPYSITGLQNNLSEYFKFRDKINTYPLYDVMTFSEVLASQLKRKIGSRFEEFRPIVNIDLEGIAKEIDADFDTLGINQYDFTEEEDDEQKLIIPTLIQPIKQTIIKLYNENDFLFTIDPRRFEEVVAELLYKKGYHVDLTKQTGDGGYDIIAISQIGDQKYKTLVECKRHSEERKIGIGIIRSFCDVLNTENANKGMIVTTSTFSKPSIIRSNSMGYKLDLVDRFELLDWTSDYLKK